jgi:hypothetical protein
MAEPRRAVEDGLRKHYAKLFTCLEAHEGHFSAQQQRHLACWHLWVVLRCQLFTDDSFIFTKVARNLQELLKALPDVEGEAEEETAEQLQVPPSLCAHVLYCRWQPS